MHQWRHCDVIIWSQICSGDHFSWSPRRFWYDLCVNRRLTPDPQLPGLLAPTLRSEMWLVDERADLRIVLMFAQQVWSCWFWWHSAEREREGVGRRAGVNAGVFLGHLVSRQIPETHTLTHPLREEVCDRRLEEGVSRSLVFHYKKQFKSASCVLCSNSK